MVVDEFARHLKSSAFTKKFGAEFAKATLQETNLLLIKPMEFMNNSGQALRRFLTFFKVEPSDVIVVHDEIDLPHGKLRVKDGGGHGGHNGLRSIFAELGSKEFQRIRVGVGKSTDPESNQSVADYVLAPFSNEATPSLPQIIKTATEALESLIQKGATVTMNQFNA